MKLEFPKFGPRRLERGYRSIVVADNEGSARSKMVWGCVICTCGFTAALVGLNQVTIPPGDLRGVMTVMKFGLMAFAALGELLVVGRFIYFLTFEL